MFWHYLEPIILVTLLSYYFPGMSFIIRIYTQDSIASSIRYIIQDDSDLPQFPKYMFYLLITAIYYSLYLLTWFSVDLTYIYYLFLIISSPSIMQLIFQTHGYILESLEQWRRRMINYVTCIFLANSINYICKSNLERDPKLTATELNKVFSPHSLTYTYTFLKIILIM